MNQGMISGSIVRVEDKSQAAGFPACIVTIAGETHRENKPLVYFEQIRVSGHTATAALALQSGDAVLFDQAVIEQQTWVERASNEPRAQLVVRGLSMTRLRGTTSKMMGEHRVLLQAVNSFTIRGRLADAPKMKTVGATTVTEGAIVVNLPEGRSSATRPHYLKVESWGHTPMSGQAKGVVTVAEVLVKTDSAMIDGKKRYFTVLEARSSAVLA
ncbi:hypothetical protein EHF33_15985 [Deinococcus psychrotolerans]|uniref:Single-stranded DNA-binding protein n=1 Tax=Deinococcus psychrotolerans TaxID=2489213 RepID=A0A3G8YGA9_9DEIO|nr:hypothetical protein [Deinococcus psychrotolerans]AZI44379.1 hypothetical protein EHF33_15985 [Deinococcus psychrotolerans]